ncbi:hypothetical protein [Sporomusa malonica]|uniref:Uncharacterized protein n=1 Tax=Sporomusa malonica TaxID=112901 RepID=A0A1W2D9R1_9FIRM|nr:hypothetical protein [Sporomusa malonica]SMC94113.1 hypothetical protein SAMN04488500_11464 [Sporomusa malonica]
MVMKGIFICAVIVLAGIISFVVGEYNHVLGEILGMAMVQPFLIIALIIVFLILYSGFRRIFNKEEKEKIIEKFTESEKEKSNSPNDYSDLYLARSILTNELIEYQILNKEKLMFGRSRCILNQGKVHSITLYSGHANKEIVLQVSEEIAGLKYLIKDSQSIIGSIKITDKGLSFNNIDNISIYTATPENVTDDGFGAVADWAIALDTLQGYSSSSKFNYFMLKGECNETLGKYYMSLRNIDLTPDTNSKFDRRIATIFSIFLDTTLIGNLGR